MQKWWRRGEKQRDGGGGQFTGTKTAETDGGDKSTTSSCELRNKSERAKKNSKAKIHIHSEKIQHTTDKKNNITNNKKKGNTHTTTHTQRDT